MRNPGAFFSSTNPSLLGLSQLLRTGSEGIDCTALLRYVSLCLTESQLSHEIDWTTHTVSLCLTESQFHIYE